MRVLDSGRDHELFHPDQEGFIGKVKQALTALGDEKRVVGRFDEAVRGGKTVVAVPATDQEAPDVATILAEHGGSHIYHFGEWTFTSVGG